MSLSLYCLPRTVNTHDLILDDANVRRLDYSYKTYLFFVRRTEYHMCATPSTVLNTTQTYDKLMVIHLFLYFRLFSDIFARLNEFYLSSVVNVTLAIPSTGVKL